MERFSEISSNSSVSGMLAAWRFEAVHMHGLARLVLPLTVLLEPNFLVHAQPMVGCPGLHKGPGGNNNSVVIRDPAFHSRLLLQQYLYLLKRYPILTKSFTRVCVTGPISHYFYQLLELLVPSSAPCCMVKRLLLDRLVFAPAFLLLFFVVMNILEGNKWPALQAKLRVSYWPALIMNWKVWTPFQFININFVPVQFRVLFANLVALFWYAYLASVRK
ncbi:peroxisomal membrane protein 2-like [Scleropages formosus]|uniref:Peroxisomal membrane protein 2-like n=1 Tax=Scleropages formosus TaxID=113540 RepID=A0A0P7UAY0_SCLFO|nr:peroxisomal membrane protein 2-like [Scleropages formosus]